MSSKDNIAPSDIAEWMAKQLEDGTYLYQNVVVYSIAAEFGDQFTYYNENGNPAIRKDVLAAFRN